MPGDTVTSIAIRLTRNSQGWRGSGFQILDPAAARFVPKVRYDHIRPGWQACIVEPVLERTAVPNQQSGRIGWWMLILTCSLTAAGLFAMQPSVARRKAVSQAMETFGLAFIREFERPLADERSSQSVLRAELALSPNRRSLEVLLAPADGRTYPNLADHRTNLEYDVERVVSLLNDRAIHLRGSPDAGEHGWPFRFVLDLIFARKVEREYPDAESWWRRRQYPSLGKSVI